MTNTGFGRRMGQKFKKLHGNNGNRYSGIGLLSEGFSNVSEGFKTQNELIPNIDSRMGNNSENPSQPFNRHDNPSLLSVNGCEGYGANPSPSSKDRLKCPFCERKRTLTKIQRIAHIVGVISIRMIQSHADTVPNVTRGIGTKAERIAEEVGK